MNTTALYRGKRNYELSNHLGNFNGCWFCEARPYRHESRERSASGVNVVISDKRKSVCDEELGVEYFVAEVLSAVDYYPFGKILPDRQWYYSNDTSGYRFAFNGKDIDREHGGAGNTYDYGFRIYIPDYGKFLSVDSLFKSYPWYTPYQFAGNKPIQFIDLDGLEERSPTPEGDRIRATYVVTLEAQTYIDVQAITQTVNRIFNSGPVVPLFSDVSPLYELPLLMGSEMYANAHNSTIPSVATDYYKKVEFDINIVKIKPEDLSDPYSEGAESRIFSKQGSLGGIIMMGSSNDPSFVLKDKAGKILRRPDGTPKTGPAYLVENKIVLNLSYFDPNNPNYATQGAIYNQSPSFLANVLTHEIGHDLGLDHSDGEYPEIGIMAPAHNTHENTPTGEELKLISSPNNSRIIQPKD